MQFQKISATATGLWFISTLAFSNGSAAPELPMLAAANQLPEYKSLKNIQSLLLDLQMLEVTIKNQKSPQLEQKTTAAVQDIELKGLESAMRIRDLRRDQDTAFFALITFLKRWGTECGVGEKNWDNLAQQLRTGNIANGTISVVGKTLTGEPRSFHLFELGRLNLGRQWVWQIKLNDRMLDRARFKPQQKEKIAELADQVNLHFQHANFEIQQYYNLCFTRLFETFSTERYAILQRMQMAKNALEQIRHSDTLMEAPEQYIDLYDRTLDSLYNYGVDLSVSGIERDFSVKGFLFGATPTESAIQLKKLKFKTLVNK